MRDLLGGLSILVIAVLWRLARSAWLRALAPLVMGGALAVSALLLAVVATKPFATMLLAAALALATVAFADALWRSPRRGPCHDVDRWGEDFERDFRTYAREHTRRPRR
jgi:hypothetical protein